jgi:hypothetical protein
MVTLAATTTAADGNGHHPAPIGVPALDLQQAFATLFTEAAAALRALQLEAAQTALSAPAAYVDDAEARRLTGVATMRQLFAVAAARQVEVLSRRKPKVGRWNREQLLKPL